MAAAVVALVTAAALTLPAPVKQAAKYHHEAASHSTASPEGPEGELVLIGIPLPAASDIPPKNFPADVTSTLACIRHYESRGNYGDDTGNGFFGAYQFDVQTWRSVGGSGNPAEASPAEQDARAARLLAERGLEPWPTPHRLCA